MGYDGVWRGACHVPAILEIIIDIFPPNTLNTIQSEWRHMARDGVISGVFFYSRATR